MSEEEDPTATLAALRTSLDSVEETLGPLLEIKWNDTTASLSTMDRAKMDILVSYAINDLIWVYLKMKGVDPATHEVSAELVCAPSPIWNTAEQKERIRTYYGKVKRVEEPESRRKTQIDKSAAGRIIKHSIPASQRTPTTSAAALARSQAEAAVAEQLGTSHRFRHIAKDTEEMSESEEEEEVEGDEAEGFLNGLDEEIRAKDGEVDAEVSSEGEGRKRKRAEDFAK